jgi:hypothetical protein
VVLVTGAVVGLGSVGEIAGDGSVGVGVGSVVPTGVALGVRLSVGVGVGVRPASGLSIRSGVVAMAVGSATGVLVGAAVGSEVRTGVVLAESSPPPNGLSSTIAINASGTAATAPSLILLGPPYRPIGPRTGRPASSTQNLHPAGAGGHDSGGRQRFGGRHRAVGGSGQSGGALNCLTLPPPVRAAA